MDKELGKLVTPMAWLLIGVLTLVALGDSSARGTDPILWNDQQDHGGVAFEIVRAPVAHYKFDGDAADSSIRLSALDGVEHGMPSYDVGVDGRAICLDGIDDYVKCGVGPQCDLEEMTIACWVRPDELDGDCGLVSQAGSYAFKVSGNLLCFATPDIWDHKGDNSILTAGIWQHVAVAFTPRTTQGVAFYVNGVRTDLLDSGDKRPGTGATLIGANQWPGEYFKGQMDDVRIYARALSEEEIAHVHRPEESTSIPRSRVVELVEEAGRLVKELKPQEAVVALEKEMVAYKKWRATNFERVKPYDARLPSDFYALLAHAKERSGTPIDEVIATCVQAVSRPREPSCYVPASLLWLHEGLPAEAYADVVRACVRNSQYPHHCVHHIARHFESKENWEAFRDFLDAVFSEVDDVTSYAKVTARSLTKGGEWGGKFLEYCQGKPELVGFLFRKQEAIARSHAAHKDHSRVAAIYRDILGQCQPHQKPGYAFRLCECLFEEGQYERAVHNLDRFVNRYKTSHRVLTAKAIMLRGQAYVYLGDIDRAIDTFLVLVVEYPEAKQTPAALFFVGYCHMLASRFEDAKVPFELLAQAHPSSEYATRATSHLDRIKRMAQ